MPLGRGNTGCMCLQVALAPISGTPQWKETWGGSLHTTLEEKPSRGMTSSLLFSFSCLLRTTGQTHGRSKCVIFLLPETLYWALTEKMDFEQRNIVNYKRTDSCKQRKWCLHLKFISVPTDQHLLLTFLHWKGIVIIQTTYLVLWHTIRIVISTWASQAWFVLHL